MPNNSISWAIDLLPNADLTYNLGKVDNSNSDNNRRWNIFGNITGSLTGNADTATTASKLTTSNLGNATKPIYLASGVATECNNYAGGTAVTLNGSSAAASTASFYAPEGAGTSGYILKSNGSGAPTWLQTLPVANGGTGATSITAYGIVYGNSDGSAYTSAACNAEGKVIVSHSSSNNIAAPSWYNGLSLTSSTSNNTTTYAANFLGTVDIDGATTISGDTTINNSGTLTVAGNTTLSSALSVVGNTTIGTSGTTNTLTVWEATTLKNTLQVDGTTSLKSTLEVDSTTTLKSTVNITGNTTIGTSTSNNSLTVNGISNLNGNVTVTGNIVPQTNQTYSLGEGTTPKRWSSIYVGSANSYGDAYTPIYWNNGVPAVVQTIQQANFTITNSGTDAGTATISTNTSANSMVVEIVVIEDTNSHISNLQEPITWTISGTSIVLSTTVSGRIDGYILYTK